MSRYKKIFALLLLLGLLGTMLTACDGATHPTETAPPTGNDGESLAEPQNTEPPATPEEVAQLYNLAVEKLNHADNYTMLGSVNSSAGMGETGTAVVSTIDCRYSKELGALFTTIQTGDMQDFDHTTYYDGSKYYYTTEHLKYCSELNDYQDYTGSDYLVLVDPQNITTVEKEAREDGTLVAFKIPFSLFASPALTGLLGDIYSEAATDMPVDLRMIIDHDGNVSYLYIYYEAETFFGDDPILQTIVASLNFSDFGSTEVTVPGDLDTYEPLSDPSENDSGDMNDGNPGFDFENDYEEGMMD